MRMVFEEVGVESRNASCPFADLAPGDVFVMAVLRNPRPRMKIVDLAGVNSLDLVSWEPSTIVDNFPVRRIGRITWAK